MSAPRSIGLWFLTFGVLNAAIAYNLTGERKQRNREQIQKYVEASGGLPWPFCLLQRR